MARIADPQPADPTNGDQIASFERHIGHPLPPAYREFLLEHNGGRPNPDAFLLRRDGDEEEDVVMCFFPMRDLSVGQIEVGEMQELRTWPLHCAWDDLQNDLEHLYETELDPPMLPVGTDGSGNYICIMLAGDETGSVVFLDHETAEHWPLASDFPEFLASLRSRVRTDYGDQLVY